MSEEVLFYWRPGCHFCSRLRADLAKRGLPIREVNIRRDPGAAAIVRAAAGGNETVPTVIIGSLSMVNPSAGEVLHAVRTHAPELLGHTDEAPGPARSPSTWTGAAATTAVLAFVWLLLASTHPDTTYHFAPLLVAAAWPAALLVRANAGLPWVTRMAGVAGGAGTALAAALLLTSLGALNGPTLTGAGSAFVETLIAIAIGSAAGFFMVLRGPGKRP